jgi:D-methionine transport system ATP-binding protein
MIQFKNISKHYQLKGQTIPALDQINLDIPEGSIFGVIGYSGAGKSTLIRLINLLERPTEGQVIINQKDFTALDAKALRQERANIGMIFQHFNLLQTKTVAANIEMPMKLLGYSKAEREKRLNELLEFIDLKHKKKLIQTSSRVVKNNVSVLHVRLPTILKYYFVTKRLLH